MAYFPRVGIELSTDANVRFLVPGASHLRPAIVQRFENGSRSGRFRTPHGTINFAVLFTGPEPDLAVMIDFFEVHGVVVPFTIDHPTRGTMAKAYLKLQEHPLEPFVNAGIPWTRINIPIEGAP